MKLSLHPEYQKYLQDWETWTRSRQVLDSWLADSRMIETPDHGLRWSPELARDFVSICSQMLQAYNQVLWEHFTYCSNCGGQCCQVGGSFISVFDCLALALLDQPFPSLADHIAARERDCIYRGAQGCLWPAPWRTLKCWLFYCLGPAGEPANEAEGRSPFSTIHYERIARELKPVIDAHLPGALWPYFNAHGAVEAADLANPLRFADRLGHAIHQALIVPLGREFPALLSGPQPGYFRDEFVEGRGQDILIFLSEAAGLADRLLKRAGMQDLATGVLQDLEKLEWIVQGRPGNARSELLGLKRHYAAPPVPDLQVASLWNQMGEKISELLESIHP